MSHSHSHSSHEHSNAAKNISVAFFLNAFFVVVEVVGGLLTNSIAILMDALHDLGDCLSLAIAWFLQKKSGRPRDLHYSYGYKRFSLLGSVFLSGILLVSSIWVISEAVGRVLNPEEVSAQGMLWLSIAGILINGAAALNVKKGDSLNERAVFLHIMEDVLGWIAVLVVSIVMLFIDLPILDPILSICISLWVLSNVYKNVRDTFRIFLQSTPEDIPVEELKAKLLALERVEGVHDLHLWSLDGESHVMTLHMITSADDTCLLKDAVVQIARTYHITHTTLEFEKPGTICHTNCDCPEEEAEETETNSPLEK